MNGRIYDAHLGRFLQADPIVQAAGDLQSYNRYSYARNNPVNLVDPSGYSWLSKTWKKVKKHWKEIVAVVVTVVIAVYLGPWAAQGFWNAVAVGALAGGANGAIMTGTLKGTLQGAVAGGISAGVFYGIGTAFQSCSSCNGNFFGTKLNGGAFAGKTLAHAAAGGVMSKLQGGHFGHGFIAAGATQAFAGAIVHIPAKMNTDSGRT